MSEWICGDCGKDFGSRAGLYTHINEFGGTCGDLINNSGEDTALAVMERNINAGECDYRE